MSTVSSVARFHDAARAFVAARKAERAAIDAIVACAESAPEFSSPPEMVELSAVAEQRVQEASDALIALGQAAEELYK